MGTFYSNEIHKLISINIILKQMQDSTSFSKKNPFYYTGGGVIFTLFQCFQKHFMFLQMESHTNSVKGEEQFQRVVPLKIGDGFC